MSTHGLSSTLSLTAQVNVELNPKQTIENIVAPQPNMSAGLRPYMSAILPQAIDETSCPAW
jgi:hypothetical protein